MLLVFCIRLASKWSTAEALQLTIEVEMSAYDLSVLRQARTALSVSHNVPPEKLRLQRGKSG